MQTHLGCFPISMLSILKTISKIRLNMSWVIVSWIQCLTNSWELFLTNIDHNPLLLSGEHLDYAGPPARPALNLSVPAWTFWFKLFLAGHDSLAFSVGVLRDSNIKGKNIIQLSKHSLGLKEQMWPKQHYWVTHTHTHTPKRAWENGNLSDKMQTTLPTY